MVADIYYDRHLRLWVLIHRDDDGCGIPNPLTGEEATYYPTKRAALEAAGECE